MKDATLLQTAAKPNAANTVNTNTIALPQQAVRPFTTTFRVRLFGAVSVGANSKNINYRLYATNEANGANAVAASEIFTIAGNAANHPAFEREVYLRPELDCSRIFASATGEANGGDASAATFGVEIVG
jgi:hypothetical protein